MSTASDYLKRAREIREAYGDPEHGHQAEDDLLERFVREVEDGALPDHELRETARVIRMELLDNERTRWYA